MELHLAVPTDNDQPVIEAIEVSLQARSKRGRYFGRTVIHERIAELDGTLFRQERGAGPWYLRTTCPQQTGPPLSVVIVFTIADGTATVLTQTTSSHYDWSEFVQIGGDPFTVRVESDRIE